jgi:hypothetical protein
MHDEREAYDLYPWAACCALAGGMLGSLLAVGQISLGSITATIYAGITRPSPEGGAFSGAIPEIDVSIPGFVGHAGMSEHPIQRRIDGTTHVERRENISLRQVNAQPNGRTGAQRIEDQQRGHRHNDPTFDRRALTFRHEDSTGDQQIEKVVHPEPPGVVVDRPIAGDKILSLPVGL